MRHLPLFGTVLSILLITCVAEAQAQPDAQIKDEGPEHHLTYTPQDVDWRPGPGSLAEGAQFAVLEGDPGRPGVFTLQIKMPDGYVIDPHWHPNVERVTVLRGTFLLGTGEEVNRAAADVLPAGTYTSMPPGMTHYAITDGETVVQLTSVGPWKIIYVEEDDDPRLGSN